MDAILEVKNLSTHFFTRAGVVKAVNEVSFTIERGATLALVGESGSGKSVLIKIIAGLLQPLAGSVNVLGEEVTTIDRKTQQQKLYNYTDSI